MRKKKRRKNKHLTLMLIPHSETRVRKFKIPPWLGKTISLFAIVFTVVLGYFIYDYQNLTIQVQRMDHVSEVNELQAREIKRLNSSTKEMERKLQEIDELDARVRELLDLEQDNLTEGISSRASVRGFRDYDQEIELEDGIGGLGISSEGLTVLGEIDARLEFVALNSEQKIEKLKNLKQEVLEKLDYLEAIPSIWPVNGRITSEFGYRKNPFGSGTEFHEGMDIAARSGSPVRATGKGKVTYAGWKSGYGRLIKISHGYGFETAYGHNSSILVKVGQTVEKGEVIARVGNTGRSTGPHVHYEIVYKGKKVEPKKYLP